MVESDTGYALPESEGCSHTANSVSGERTSDSHLVIVVGAKKVRCLVSGAGRGAVRPVDGSELSARVTRPGEPHGPQLVSRVRHAHVYVPPVPAPRHGFDVLFAVVSPHDPGLRMFARRNWYQWVLHGALLRSPMPRWGRRGPAAGGGARCEVPYLVAGPLFASSLASMQGVSREVG